MKPAQHNQKNTIPKPVVLLILDGWGYRKDKENNGIEMAKKPFFDSLWKKYPHTLIDGSGEAVGLPKGIMGNSEVGHMNLGAGRIVFSGLSQIYNSIETKEFFKNRALLKAMQQAKQNGRVLHLLGLVSDGAVHSHEDHLYALLKMAKAEGVEHVDVHCILDGRDTSPREAKHALQRLKIHMQNMGIGRIASVSGRYFAMDRDKNWDRIEKAYFAIHGLGDIIADAEEYVEACYQNNITDEFIPPRTVSQTGTVRTLKEDDAVIFFNFRADRAREISHALTDQVFNEFDRKRTHQPCVFVCLSPYDVTLQCDVAFTPEYPQNTLSHVLAEHGKRQLRIAETEKYAHVTFFFSGGVEAKVQGEERILVPSDKSVATYDLKPEMSAKEVTALLVEKIQNDSFDFIVCNYANTDMVGHTAVPKAIIKAVETIDECIKDVVQNTLAKGGCVLVTADHGNAEMMKDEQGRPQTSHTTNLVPCILIGEDSEIKLKSHGGRLCDVAPTVLEILNIDKPQEMTGESLIERTLC